MENLEHRFNRWRVAAIEAEGSKPEVISSAKSLEELSYRETVSEIKIASGIEEGKSDGALGAKVEMLEKKMNEKNDEIRKMKSYLRLLVTDARKQTKDVTVNMDELIDKMKDEMVMMPSADSIPVRSLSKLLAVCTFCSSSV